MKLTKLRNPEKKERRKKFNSVSKLAVEAIVSCSLISCGGDNFQTARSLASDAAAGHVQSDAGAADSAKDSAPEAAADAAPKDASSDAPADGPLLDAPLPDSSAQDSAPDAPLDAASDVAQDAPVDSASDADSSVIDSALDSSPLLEGYSFCRTVTGDSTVALPGDYTHEIDLGGSSVDFETMTVFSGSCETANSERGFFVDGDVVFVKSEDHGELTYAFAYGNPSIKDKSSGEDAFLFYEDFEASILDLSKWSVDTGPDPSNCTTQSLSLGGGLFQIEAKSSSVYSCKYAIATNETFSPPLELELFDLRHQNWGGTGDSGYYRSSTEGFKGSAERAFFYVGEHGRLTYANASQSPDNSFFEPSAPFDLNLVWRDDQVQSTVNGIDGYPAVFDTPASSLSISVEVSNWKVTKPAGKSELGEVRLRRWVSEDPTYVVGPEQHL